MSRVIVNLTATFLALAAVVTADAQVQQPRTSSQQPPSTQQPPEEPRDTPARAAKQAPTVTLIGCVRSAAAPGGFVLANTDPATAPPASPAPATERSAAGTSYSLVTLPSEDLTKHLNHKVEVTGVLGPPAPPSPEASTQKSIVEPVGTITVQSVRMVSASCP
jgi:hypothetical protein